MRVRNSVIFLAAGLVTLTCTTQLLAQAVASTRIRGVIEKVDAHMMTVKTRNGDALEIALAEPLSVSTVKRYDLKAIGPGNYVGIATRTGPDGAQQAIEVLVFPDAMRGVGEGSYAWDLEPGSTMTNGTVNGAVKSVSATQLTVAYKDGSRAIEVVPGAPVVTVAPAERADVKPGVAVFLSATKNAEGKYSASRVTVGKDGVAPPM